MGYELAFIRQLKYFLILIIIAILFTGCSNQTKPNNETTSTQVKQREEQEQKGYLATFRDAAMFIQWTEVDKKLSGQLHIAVLKNNKIESKTHPFNGITNGSNISISFTGSVWTDSMSGVTWTGTLESNKLTLVYSAKDGTLQTIAFKPASVSDYNKVIINFQAEGNAQASKEALEKKQNDNREALQKKQTETRNNLDSVLVSLNKDTNTLSAISFDKDIDSLKSSLENLQKQYADLRANATAGPLTQYKLNNVIRYSLENKINYTLENQLRYRLNNGLGYNIRNAQGLSKQISNEITTLQNSWQEYLTCNTPDSQFNQEKITSVINQAKNEQATLENKTSSAQEEGNYYYEQGKKLYQTAKEYVSGLRAVSN